MSKSSTVVTKAFNGGCTHKLETILPRTRAIYSAKGARRRLAPARWDRREREGSLVVVQGATALISKNWRHPTGGRLVDGVQGRENSPLGHGGCREEQERSA